MARNDYHLIVYKILLYYYACLKREAVFNETVFKKDIGDVEENYLEDIIRNLVIEEYIRGLHFTKAWGSTYPFLRAYHCGTPLFNAEGEVLFLVLPGEWPKHLRRIVLQQR